MSLPQTDDVTEDHNDEPSLDTEDHEISAEEGEEVVTAPQAVPDLDPEIEQEIKKVIIEEEPPKAKGQVLPEHLINKALEPDDLFDAGSI